MNETVFVNKIKAYLKSNYVWVLKIHGHKNQQAGVPDLIVSHKGRFAGIEVKVGTNKATALQRLTLLDIIKSGSIGIVISHNDCGVVVSVPVNPYEDNIIHTCKLKELLDGGWLIRFLGGKHRF